MEYHKELWYNKLNINNYKNTKQITATPCSNKIKSQTTRFLMLYMKKRCFGFYEVMFQIEQNYMTNCAQQSDEIYPNIYSPYRITPLKHNLQHHHIQNTQSHTHPTSLTEQQIYSRHIVREIIDKEKNKTIRHEIGKVDASSSLFARPRTHDPRQFIFGSIPPHDPNYSSLGSAKIHQINKGMRSRATTASLTSSKRYNTKKSSHKIVDNTKIQVSCSRISVSGLATYKFESVKAERSLAMNRTDYEEKLEKQLQSIRKRKDCGVNRINKILLKQSSRRFNEKIRRSNKTMGDFQNKDILAENERERLLYGDKAKKLEFIKDYMNLEQADYETATHIIQQIENCRDTYPPENKQKPLIKTEINEDLQFARRRTPLTKNRLKVRCITFVE